MAGGASVVTAGSSVARRFQLAAAWLRHLAGDQVEVMSGGSAQAEQVNAAAVRRGARWAWTSPTGTRFALLTPPRRTRRRRHSGGVRRLFRPTSEPKQRRDYPSGRGAEERVR